MKTLSTILLTIVLLFTLSQLDQPVQALQEYQLNLSHIECRGTYIEIHFVLLNTVQGDVISDLTYTYGTIPPGQRSGNVVHFTDNVDTVLIVKVFSRTGCHNPGQTAYQTSVHHTRDAAISSSPPQSPPS